MTRVINFMKTAKAGAGRSNTSTRHQRRADEHDLVVRVQKQLKAEGVNMSNDQVMAAIRRQRLK